MIIACLSLFSAILSNLSSCSFFAFFHSLKSGVSILFLFKLKKALFFCGLTTPVKKREKTHDIEVVLGFEPRRPDGSPCIFIRR